MDVAPPKRGGRRPKAPDVEFIGAEVDVGITGAEAPIASSRLFTIPAASPVDRSFSRDTTDEAEPVSITELEAVFLPGHAPPLWDSGPEPVSLDRTPISPSADSAPSSFQPVSDRDLVFASDRPDTAPPPAIGRKPSFFRTDDATVPRSRLFDAEPAPFDPTVPALPVRIEPHELSDEDRRNPDSGLLDIRQLMARDDEQRPRPKRDEIRADDDIFNLSGGLFGGGTSGPFAAPDLSAMIAPVLPESSRPSALLAPQKNAPPRPRSPATAALSVDTGASGSSAPVGSERRASPAASRRSARAGWAVAIAALGVGLMLVSLKLGKASPTTTTIMAAETAPHAIVPVETAKAVIPIVTARPVEAPASTSAARDPGAVVKRDKDAVAAIPATAAPRSPASTAVAAPVVAAPLVAAPPPPPPPPPPSSGAEFDIGAARASLTAAAGRAAGCKQPDDPSGGATVSVTFAPSGRVTSAKVTSAPFQGTVIGGCIASAFRSASVPPFEGAPVNVTKNVSIR